jgi:hypothetical protein
VLDRKTEHLARIEHDRHPHFIGLVPNHKIRHAAGVVGVPVCRDNRHDAVIPVQRREVPVRDWLTLSIPEAVDHKPPAVPQVAKDALAHAPAEEGDFELIRFGRVFEFRRAHSFS